MFQQKMIWAINGNQQHPDIFGWGKWTVLFSSPLWTLRPQSSCCTRRQEMQLLSEKARKYNPLQCSKASIYSSKGNLILPATTIQGLATPHYSLPSLKVCLVVTCNKQHHLPDKSNTERKRVPFDLRKKERSLLKSQHLLSWIIIN